MKFVSIIVALCAVCVHCQPPTNRRGPPRPPPANGNRTPVVLPSETGSDPSSNGGVSFSASVSMPAAMSTDDQTSVASSPSLVSMSSSQGTTQVEVPARPKGCSPGCGPTEICAELGTAYCSPVQQICSVCIKMSSIRFPASAISNMFSQQAATVPATPAPIVQPAAPAGSFPYDTSGHTLDLGQSSLLQYVAQPAAPAAPAPAQLTNTDQLNVYSVQPQSQPQPQPQPVQQAPAADPTFQYAAEPPAQQMNNDPFGYYAPQSPTFDLFGFNTGFNNGGFNNGFNGGNNNNLLHLMMFDPFGFGFGF